MTSQINAGQQASVQPTSNMPPEIRFFRYFQQELRALLEQVERLGGTAEIGGERADAIDHCLAGISRLNKEVKEASSYVPTHDQKVYADAIKALHDKLADTRNKLAPRSRFAFKTARKNPSAMSLADMAEIDAQGRRNLTSTPSGAGSGTQSPAVLSGSSTPAPGFTPIPIATNGSSSNSGSTTPVTSTATSASAVTLSSLRGIYVISPHPDKTASTLPAYVSDVQNSVIDMTGPREDPATTAITARPFAGLAIRQAVHSVLVCGQVDGPAHVTSVRHAVLVVACQQFRMHECSDVDVYLSCASKPIIEACTNIRFAPLPAFYAKQITLPTTDQWNQVQDFGWIKAEPSPNWSLLPEDDAVPATLWREVGAVDRPRESLDAMLRAAKVVD